MRPGLALLVVLSACAARPVGQASPAVLWLGGDVHLGAGDGAALLPVREVTGGEALVVNLEGPVGDGAAASTAERLVNGPGAAKALAAAGVRAAQVDNNHAGDLGVDGRAATRRALEAAGVLPAGVARFSLGATRVVLVGVDLGPATVHSARTSEGAPPASGTSDTSAPAPFATTAAGWVEGESSDVLERRLRAAKTPEEALIVTFHVTGPPSYLPTPELEAAVEAALRAGATVVAAHGTHAVARVERRGDAVIAWGLGNLVFDCRCTEEEEGLLLRVELDASGRVGPALVVPVDAGLHGTAVRPARDRALLLRLLESLGSTPLRPAGLGARL
ncbi:MAG: CapA family protein [Myxococcota bacterium]